MSQPGDRSLRKLTVPMNYNSRQRVLCALDHEEPDRVPLFIGASGATTVLGPGYEALTKAFGHCRRAGAMAFPSHAIHLDGRRGHGPPRQ